MAYIKNSSAAFTGASGQVAVMGELLQYQCNAAIPLVDVGTDVFAFRDDREEVARIQVKTATAKRYKNEEGYSARFSIPIAQLSRADAPPLFYALAVRLDDGWGSFVVISRTNLQQIRYDGVGTENPKSGNLELYIRFPPHREAVGTGDDETQNDPDWRVLCGECDLTEYINAWESLPPLKPKDFSPQA